MRISNISLEDFPTREKNMQSIFKSLLREQAALSKLIRLEAVKIKGFAEFSGSPEDILKFVQSTKRISGLIALKGLFLHEKIQNILLIEEKFLKGEEGEENESGP